MTTKKRRPHSCGTHRRNIEHDYRFACGISDSHKLTISGEKFIALSPEKQNWYCSNRTGLKKGIASVSFPDKGPDLTPRMDSATYQKVIDGKCDGLKSHGLGLKEPGHFYLTTNKRDFEGNQGIPAPLTRPKSSKFYPAENKFLNSLYGDEYCEKKKSTDLPIRSGTASGNRKNNPHPLESFMIWKFPGRLPSIDHVTDIHDNTMQMISRESLKSTYQMDYAAISQDHNSEYHSIHVPSGCTSDKGKYTLDSTSRFEYQQPKLHQSLTNNTTRYGCNARKCVPAIGAVPNVSTKTPSIQMQGNTLYSQEYHDKSADAKVSEHVRPIIVKKLNRYLQNQNREDENTARILQKLEEFERSDDRQL